MRRIRRWRYRDVEQQTTCSRIRFLISSLLLFFAACLVAVKKSFFLYLKKCMEKKISEERVCCMHKTIIRRCGRIHVIINNQPSMFRSIHNNNNLIIVVILDLVDEWKLIIGTNYTLHRIFFFFIIFFLMMCEHTEIQMMVFSLQRYPNGRKMMISLLVNHIKNCV